LTWISPAKRRGKRAWVGGTTIEDEVDSCVAKEGHAFSVVTVWLEREGGGLIRGIVD